MAKPRRETGRCPPAGKDSAAAAAAAACAPRAAAGAPAPAPVALYRATNGKKRKFSTIVGAADAARFHAAYMNVVKGSMSALKKIDKEKEKTPAKKVGGTGGAAAAPAPAPAPGGAGNGAAVTNSANRK